jgi:predicted nucleic acid-binding protein
MKLVIDASTLVAEGLRLRGRERLAHPHLELYLAEHTYNEAKHELSKRFSIFVKRTKLSEASAKKLHQDVFTSLELPFVVLEAGYQPFEKLAKERIRDVNDWPTLALAMLLECGIWTQDYDFFGTGIATWSTETIDRILQKIKPAKRRR